MSGVIWVSPLAVYRAASSTLRLRFWLAVVFCVGVAPVAVVAQSQQPSPMQEWLSPAVVIALLSAAVTVGSTINDMREVKRELEQSKSMYASVESVDLKHAAVLQAVQSVRDEVRALTARFEGYFPQLNAQINKIEKDVSDASKQIAVLQTLAGVKDGGR